MDVTARQSNEFTKLGAGVGRGIVDNLLQNSSSHFLIKHKVNSWGHSDSLRPLRVPLKDTAITSIKNYEIIVVREDTMIV